MRIKKTILVSVSANGRYEISENLDQLHSGTGEGFWDMADLKEAVGAKLAPEDLDVTDDLYMKPIINATKKSMVSVRYCGRPVSVLMHRGEMYVSEGRVFLRGQYR